MKPVRMLSVLSVATILSLTGCSANVATSRGASSRDYASADITTNHQTRPISATTELWSSPTVRYVVNGQTVMTGTAIAVGRNGTTYLPLSDVEDLLLPTLHVEASQRGNALNLTGTWEPNPFHRLPAKQTQTGKGALLLEVNGHPYGVGQVITREVHGAAATYVSAPALATFLQNALNVHARWHANQFAMQVGNTLFSYQSYNTVKPAEKVPSYMSGQVSQTSFPNSIQLPANSPWMASPLGVATSYTWNVVPPGYGWYWAKGTVTVKHIQSTSTVVQDSYNGTPVMYRLVKQYAATQNQPAIAVVDLAVGHTQYLLELYRPRFTYAWAIYNEVAFTPTA